MPLNGPFVPKKSVLKGRSLRDTSGGRRTRAKKLPSSSVVRTSKLNGATEVAELPVRHFLGHVQNQLAIAFFRLAQQAAKLVEKTGFFADTAPGDIVGRPALGEVRQLWRFFTVIKELIERHFKSTSQLFKRFDRGNCMAVLHARNVTPKQAGTLLDVALRKFLFFAECAKTITDNHEAIIP